MVFFTALFLLLSSVCQANTEKNPGESIYGIAYKKRTNRNPYQQWLENHDHNHDFGELDEGTGSKVFLPQTPSNFADQPFLIWYDK